ncbi:MAG TPA: prepilin-type N-terminal cleavage/methylation domain-containing protein [Polyangiaceae bacterium]|nr:prepilin-type N-terminal cleavage/methylation domain-containing protein [Polyangiaceae bacterium]
MKGVFRSPRLGRRKGRAGYTFIELLMSLAILTIGVTGVVAMQKVTISSGQHARDLAIATQIAQAWIDQLRTDALAWNHPSARQAASDLGQTIWLAALVGNDSTDFALPAWNATRKFGPAFDVQGKPVDVSDADNVPLARFCTHIRLSWLYPETEPVLGNGLIRVEVRVFWPRDGAAPLDGGNVCGGTPDAIGEATDRYHFVYKVSAVRQNTAP